MKKKYLDIWYKHALIREGERLKVYKDSLGKPTVGIGHLVLPEDNLKVGDKITATRSKTFFEKDTVIAEQAALEQAGEIGVTTDKFIAALISVNFQLGTKWTKVFKTTYPLIVKHDFDKAIENLKKSRWYKQTPVRVYDFIKALKHAKETLQQKPLSKSRTIAGSTLAGASVVVSEAADKIEPLTGYSNAIQTIFVFLALAGVALAIYARVDDRNKGAR